MIITRRAKQRSLIYRVETAVTRLGGRHHTHTPDLAQDETPPADLYKRIRHRLWRKFFIRLDRYTICDWSFTQQLKCSADTLSSPSAC